MAKVTFDGVNKIIQVNNNITSLDVKIDLYSDWKEWTLISDNSKFLPAFSAIGGDPLPSSNLGTTYFIENGWKIRPYEGNHTLRISGNLYARDGSDPVINTTGSFNVRVVQTVSNIVDTITTSGSSLTAQQVATAVRDELQSELAHLVSLANGLTTTQATQLLEIYNLYGLDPTKPLIVSNTTRSAGFGISQTITKVANQTTIQRV